MNQQTNQNIKKVCMMYSLLFLREKKSRHFEIIPKKSCFINYVKHFFEQTRLKI